MTALALTRPERLASLKPFAATLATLRDVEITSPATETQVREVLARVDRVMKEIEKQRKAEKDPILKAGKELDREYAEALSPIEIASGILRARLGAWLRHLEEKRQEALRLASEASQALDHETANAAIVEVAAAAPAVVAGQYDRHTWSIESIDETILAREYMSPDPVKIRAAIKEADSHGIAPAIVGVVFRREIKTTVRS